MKVKTSIMIKNVTDHLFPLVGTRKHRRAVKKAHRLPTEPGNYRDQHNHVWTLTDNGVWVDEAGNWADPSYNWLLTDLKLMKIS